MQGEVSWKRRFRSATASWVIVSAMSGPLVIGYHILSSQGRLPPAPDHAGVLTIVVNTCIMTCDMLLTAGLFAFGFTALAGGNDKLWIRILKVLGLALMGYLFLISGTKYAPLVGAAMLIAAICAISPAAKYVDKYEAKIGAALLILLVATFFLRPDWMQDWWTSLSSRHEYRLIPLSAMSFGDWILALGGAMIYVGSYIEFQQWRTDGKWLEETKKRLRGDP